MILPTAKQAVLTSANHAGAPECVLGFNRAQPEQVILQIRLHK